MKTLHLTYSDGERRTVTPDGNITRYNIGGRGNLYVGSPGWVFLGFSFTARRARVQLTLADALADPTRLCRRRLIGWDRDHGTVRQNVSPRIVTARVEER